MKLHSTPFNVYIVRDENRASDGRNLRGRFAFGTSYQDYSVLDQKPCSMLEMMVALCERFDEDNVRTDESGNRMKLWFWEMLQNTGLDFFDDSMSYWYSDEGVGTDEIMSEIIEKVNRREYSDDGSGGFFPLKEPKNDQRLVEIWLQMQAYFQEKHADLI